MEQIVDLLASFPKSGRTLKTELRIMSYARLNFRAKGAKLRVVRAARICPRVLRVLVRAAGNL